MRTPQIHILRAMFFVLCVRIVFLWILGSSSRFLTYGKPGSGIWIEKLKASACKFQS